VLKKLRASYPQYNKSITFVLIDWDKYGSHAVTTSRKVPRRSTMLLIKDGTEIGRIVAQTSKQKIKELLDDGLR
jgi:thioredoxin 1